MSTVFPRPLLMGHRGAGGEAPENTWPAFESARVAGMHGFEVDVLLTRDNVPVAVHDLTLQRIAGGHRAVQEVTWPAISGLDAGSHFHPRFAGERIPRLEDVLDHYGRDMIIDIELKGYSPFSEGMEEAVISLVREKNLSDQVIISSFNPFTIMRLKSMAPEIKTGFNYLSDSIRQIRRVWFAPFLPTFSKHPQPHQVDQSYVQRQHKKGIWVIPWGVSQREEMERLLHLGVDGIISNFPSTLRSLIDERGTAPR